MRDDKFLPGPQFIFPATLPSLWCQVTYRVTETVGVPLSYSPLLVGYLDIPPRYLGSYCRGKKRESQEQPQNNRARYVPRHGADTVNWRRRGCCSSLLIPAQLWWVGSSCLVSPPLKVKLFLDPVSSCSTFLTSNGSRLSSRQQNYSSAEPSVMTVIVRYTVISVRKTVNKSKSEIQAQMT